MIDKLVKKIKETKAPIVVGLDPMLSYVPEYIKKTAFDEYGETLEGAAEAIWQYNKGIVDAVHDLIPAVKPQIAMYEQFGIEGLKVFQKTVDYCMYNSGSSCVALSSTLCGGNKDTIAKTAAIYDYVINNISYVSTAENGANGYIPVPDTVLANKSGICFDYASLMAAMLRSQKIPTKVVVGYAGDIYHAWISVYVDGSGWIDGYIYFDGNKWNRMDPTFAASAKDENDYKSIVDFISDGSNYSVIYYY